jgi:asparagine synthase (glutamine-hydrolysing)
MSVLSEHYVTTGSRAAHASVVGMVDPESVVIEARDAWRQCVARSASRTHAPLTLASSPPLLVAYRGNPGSFYQDDSYAVMLDGGIDNLRELFVSAAVSDTGDAAPPAELVSGLFARDGNAIFGRFTGSFALVIVTRSTGQVILVRDRFGTRPLFYAATRTGWTWASEIKCLTPLLDRVMPDQEGLRQSLHYRYTTGGETLITGVSQVLPACFVLLAPDQRPVEISYWKLEFRPSLEHQDLGHWADRTESALDAYFARLRGEYRDIGILLSGGVDSSLLALKASRAGFRSCVALTAKWPGENPELEAATAVARHIGIEHHVVEIDDSSFKEAFPWLVWRMEELPRHINSLVLARLFEAASLHCDALLNGHTADVLFGPQMSIAIDTFRRRKDQLKFIPRFARLAVARQLSAIDNDRVARLKRYLQLDLHEYMASAFRIDFGGLAETIFASQFTDTATGRRGLDQFYDPHIAPTERFQRFDLYTFNQSQMTVYDRLSAPLGINVLMPFVSPEVVDVAVELPSPLKFTGDTAKPVLKAVAARYFPRQWIYRKKQGFPTQTARWLGGALGDWRGMLTGQRATSRGILDFAALETARVGRDDEAIWTAISLEMFFRQFIDGEAGPESSEITSS